MSNLKDKRCGVCNVGMSSLPSEKSKEYLQSLNGWRQIKNAIEREFTFNSFGEALKFFNKVAMIAEAEGHHPDMCIHRWKNVKLVFTTYVASGLTINDFIMATKVDELHKEV